MDCTKNLFALKLSKKYKMSDEDFTEMYSLRRDGVNLRITETDFNEWFEVVDDDR